jgi:putative Mn2+ efflux pump MntP
MGLAGAPAAQAAISIASFSLLCVLAGKAMGSRYSRRAPRLAEGLSGIILASIGAWGLLSRLASL